MTAPRLRHAIVLLALGASPAFAQAAGGASSSEPITLKDLRTPSAPAFTLLGVSPTDIERPTTPRAFAVSLLSAVQRGNNGLLPNDFSLEVAPYWLTPHPGLDFETYANPHPVQAIRQTLSFSVATAKVPAAQAGAATDLMDIGIGVRASPWAGRTGKDVATLKAAITVANTRAALIDALIALLGTPRRALPDPPSTTLLRLRNAPHAGLTDEQHTAMFDEVTGAIEQALAASSDPALMLAALRKLRTDGDAARKKAALELQTANQKRIGFTLDLAGGLVTRTLEAETSHARVTRTGVWATPGYNDDHLSILGVVRYLRNTDDPVMAADLVDLGGRFVGTVGDLTVSFEAIRRSNRSPLRVRDSTERAVVNFEYKVNEDVTITSTFGKDYGDTRFGYDGTTISLLGVNFGLGARPGLPVNAK